jgi:alkyl hydroperoxide reductase subunit AhpC
LYSRHALTCLLQVFIIDPKKTIRLILSYPASTGRNTAEVLRVLDSLQTGDKHRITTPINWVPGDDVIVHPSVKNDEAKTLFPDFRIVKPYLRFVRTICVEMHMDMG